MASGNADFSLDAIKAFMLSRGGRVTNHELVHQFKDHLTNSDTKELARDQFKHFVNTLCLVVKEDNNKYLVLKKKYRGDVPLDSILRSPDARAVQSSDNIFNASPNNQNYAPQNAAPSEYGAAFQAASQGSRSHVPLQHSAEVYPEPTNHKKNETNPFMNYQQYETTPPYSSHQYQRRDSNSSFSGSSPSHQGPGPQDFPAPPLPPRQMSNQGPFNGAPSTTRLRTPPPYRPPPPPPESPVMDNFNSQYSPQDFKRFPPPPAMNQLRHQAPNKDYRSPEQHQNDRRRPSYDAHSEEGFHHLNRSTSFNEPADLGIPIAQNFQPGGSQHSHSLHNLAQSSQSKPSGHRQPPPPTDGMLQSRTSKSKPGSPSSDASQPSSDDSAERRTMDKARQHKNKTSDHNKENFGPRNNLKYPRQGSLSSPSEDSEATAPPTPGESEKKISVKEKTQIFNRMASETNLNEKAHKNGSKSNRSSRAEKEYDESISITSYGEDGQDWLVAAASSDFNEILRLLKAHPELIRRKDRHNGYTALHWAAKHGRGEVVKLLAGTHQADPNARSNGGYTPLHLAAMYNRQDVFDLLVHYGSDLNIRDYSGKKPRQYNTIASSTISPEHHKRKYRTSVAQRSGHAHRHGPPDAKHRPVGPGSDTAMSPDETQHFKRAEKQRSSLFARGSLFSSKRKAKPKPSVIHTIVHPIDQIQDSGRQSGNHQSVDLSHSEDEEMNVAKVEHTTSPKRGALRTRAKRGQPGRPLGPPRHDPTLSSENIAYPHGPPIRRGMGYPGPRGRGKRLRGKPRGRNSSMSAPAHYIPPHVRRDRSATVPKEKGSGDDTIKSKLSRNVSIFSITSLFSTGKKKSHKRDTSDEEELQESASYKDLSEAVDAEVEYIAQKPRKRVPSKRDQGTGSPVQTFKPYRSAGKPTTHNTQSPSPWPMPETVPSLRSRRNSSDSDSSASIQPEPIKSKHKAQSKEKKEVLEPLAATHSKKKSSRESEEIAAISSSKPSRVKRYVEQEKRASRAPASSRYEVNSSQSLGSSDEETESDSEESETESDDSSLNKKISALSIKAKLDAKKAKKQREAQGSHANGETPV